MIELDMDQQEIAEREEASTAYANEDPKHFVDYCDACVKESMEASKDIRDVWDKCWDAMESEINYEDKEDWQSQAATDEPFITVQQAKAVIRRALLRQDYFNIEGVEIGDKDFSNILKKSFDFWLNTTHADFPTSFADASEMGLAVGQSSEIIVKWDDRLGLTLPLIEPWKIHRDPDAVPRDPWSGMYWIHEEYLDLWALKQDGGFKNLDAITPASEKDKSKAEERKRMIYKRSDYRKAIRVREFWGVVLDKKGDLLLQNATYTVGADQVIKDPSASPYVRARWPGVSFSPFTHLLRFQGKGILEGVVQLWWLLCNLMNLDIDNMNWVVNPSGAIDPSALIDPSDLSDYPAKRYLVNTGRTGDFFKEFPKDARSGDILGRLQYWRQQFENGSLVNQFVAGLPGTRSNITKGEVEIKTQQSMGVFDSIGKDLEAGGVNVLWLIYETIMLNWTAGVQPSIRWVGGEMNEDARAFNMMSVQEREQLLEMNCDITINGISAELQKLEKLQAMEPLTELAKDPQYAQFMKPYKFLMRIAELQGFREPDFIMTDEEVQQLMMLKGSQLWNAIPPEFQMVIQDILRNIDFKKIAQFMQQGGMA